MKILYAIQGTGNGHLSRAMEIIPVLQQKAEVDILISGTQVDLQLPFPVKYRFNGMSFIFGKKGGVDILNTYAKLRSRKFAKEIKHLPLDVYDFVLNDFEPVSAWAAYFKNKPCIALSNQCAIFSSNVPKPKHRDLLGELILKYYAPSTAEYGFHFAKYNSKIFTPIVRKEVRELEVSNKGHYTVYLPAYDDKRIIKHLSKIKNVKWEVFSKHNKKPLETKNLVIKPISNEAFLHSLASCEGILTGAGFGTTAEALFLKKKLMVIPMKAQYEQHCNAASLKEMGIPVIKSLKKKHLSKIELWIEKGYPVEVDYPDCTEQMIEQIIQDFEKSRNKPLTYFWGNNQVREAMWA